MDALIILDTTTTPNEIITCQDRAGAIKVLEPSNCTMIVEYVEGAPDIIESVTLPVSNQTIDTVDISKGYFHYDVNILRQIWTSTGVDVALIDAYIAANDLSGYNPSRGYLIYDTELLKPFLLANGVDISKVLEFEETFE